MPEIIQLNESHGWTRLGSSGMRLRAPGLKGNLIGRPPSEHAPFMASAILPGAADPVEQALQEAGLEDKGSFNAAAGAMSIAGPPNQLVLERPIAPDQIEFAIYRDESGIISLHLPLPAPPTAALLAAPASAQAPQLFHYVIPMRHEPTPIGGVPRMAMLGGIPGKIIRCVGGAVPALVGNVVYAAAKLWEDNYRPEGFLWGGTPNDLLATKPVAPSAANWLSIEGNNSLLFIHGTISSTVGAYIGLRNFS